MAIQAVTSFIYQIVQHSWLVSTVLIKYVLVLHIAELFYSYDQPNLKHLEDVILKYSHGVVAGILALGTAAAVTSFSPEPFFKAFSQVVTVTYYGFLFWKF